MTTADDVLAFAISQLGYREGSGNATKFGAWYGLDNQPWCDMFVSWCFEQAGGASIGGHFAYCPSHVNWFKNRGQWITKSQGPQRGDVIFYDWATADGTADHVGIVESVTDGMYPLAIEGNSADGNTSEGVAVARHARSLSTILGYGRPAYSGSSSSAYRPIPNIPGAGSSSPYQEDDMFTTDDANRLKNIEKALQYPGGGGSSWSQALANELAEIKRMVKDVQGQAFVPGQPYTWDAAFNNKLDAALAALARVEALAKKTD